MTRGDYTVQEVEASKQAGRDSSYRTCILTMFIFLALCIILLVIAWTTWRPMSEKEAYPHHSVSQRQSNSLCPFRMIDLEQQFSSFSYSQIIYISLWTSLLLTLYGINVKIFTYSVKIYTYMWDVMNNYVKHSQLKITHDGIWSNLSVFHGSDFCIMSPPPHFWGVQW